jgi:hypothetical protein
MAVTAQVSRGGTLATEGGDSARSANVVRQRDAVYSFIALTQQRPLPSWPLRHNRFRSLDGQWIVTANGGGGAVSTELFASWNVVGAAGRFVILS